MPNIAHTTALLNREHLVALLGTDQFPAALAAPPHSISSIPVGRRSRISLHLIHLEVNTGSSDDAFSHLGLVVLLGGLVLLDRRLLVLYLDSLLLLERLKLSAEHIYRVVELSNRLSTRRSGETGSVLALCCSRIALLTSLRAASRSFSA